ncbi:MAG: type II secretion system protein [Candidatus Rifleibacteriota bacterium]
MQTGKHGFSLLELLLVIGIIAALVGLALPYYQDYVGQSKNSVMRSNLQVFKRALMDYKADKGVYPDQTLLSVELVPKYLMEFPMDPEDNSVASWGYTFPGGNAQYDLATKYKF